MSRRITKAHPLAAIKAIDTAAGTFEAIVAVFGNVDRAGDRIAPTAFDASLARWKSSGDPVPIIFSHQWDNLGAYLGTADPNTIEVLTAGDPRLPDGLKGLGGLLVRGVLDVSEPEGRKAAKLLKARAIREFSFAYEVLDEARAADGANDLLELDLIEAGPTLKGANPATALLAAKSVDRADVAATFLAFGYTSDEVKARVGAKLWVQVPGSIERHLEAVRMTVRAWASVAYGDDLYEVTVEGTFADPPHVLAYVELWSDPFGGGNVYRLGYSVAGDVVQLDDPEPMDVALELTPATKTEPEPPATKTDPEPPATKADPEPPATKADPGPGRSPAPGTILATIAADLLDL